MAPRQGGKLKEGESDRRRATIAVIGGSGLYQMDGLTDVENVRVKTPFGDPSDAIILGTLEGRRVAFLPRHGRGHVISPTELPSRANIYALKSLGVERIISVNAVGSLREDIRPQDMVIPDQVIDRTKNRVNSLFEGSGVVVHCGFADPFCADLSGLLYKAARRTHSRTHRGGTYIAMEGPLFSTRAESELYRSWGGSVIGMTVLPEAKLAREAEICYASLSCSTDYDCWRPEHDDVTVEMVISNLLKNVAVAKGVLRRLIAKLPAERTCGCASALKNAIVTARDSIPARARRDLTLLLGKYVQ
ncbi:MAG: S-methyl-5'-thioadenosine phosphorylase [Dehalococcoidia bacterium]|nr:S-methyl-5'-thioadenosine phosphorylase [Dehalococcoidia bacterium]